MEHVVTYREVWPRKEAMSAPEKQALGTFPRDPLLLL